MQIYTRYLFRELLKNFLAVFSVLQVIVTVVILIRLLEDSSLNVPLYGVIFRLFAYISLDTVIITLPFASMLAVVLAFGRCRSDNETCAAFSIGISYLEMSKAVALFALPLAILLFVFMLESSPALHAKHEQIETMLEQGMDVSNVVSGKFISIGKGLVIFAEAHDRNTGNLKNIFIAQPHKSTVEIAKTGKQATLANGDKRFYLRHGYRYHGIPGNTPFYLSRFDEYWIEFPPPRTLSEYHDVRAHSFKELDTTQPDALAELHRRLSMPVSLILLSFFAFAISLPSRSDKRFNSHYTLLIVAVVFFLLYTNSNALLVKLGSGHAGFLYLMWAMHTMLASYTIAVLSSSLKARIITAIRAKQNHAYF